MKRLNKLLTAVILTGMVCNLAVLPGCSKNTRVEEKVEVQGDNQPDTATVVTPEDQDVDVDVHVDGGQTAPQAPQIIERRTEVHIEKPAETTVNTVPETPRQLEVNTNITNVTPPDTSENEETTSSTTTTTQTNPGTTATTETTTTTTGNN